MRLRLLQVGWGGSAEAQALPGAGWWSDALELISADGRPSPRVLRVELKAAARRSSGNSEGFAVDLGGLPRAWT